MIAAGVSAAGCGRVGFDPGADALGDASDAGDARLFSYREAVLADLPVAYWRLADTAAMARDEVGQIDGTYIGTCTHRVAPLILDADPAAGFDGSTCDIQLGTQLPVFAGNAPFTIEAWASISNNANYQIIFMHESRNAIDPIDGYALLNSPGGAYFERVTNLNNRATNAIVMQPNRAYHFAGVYDGATVYFYVDGAQAVPSLAAPTPMAAYTAQAFIGVSVMGTLFIGGTLDEVALYDHALTPERIDLHHRIGLDGPSAP